MGTRASPKLLLAALLPVSQCVRRQVMNAKLALQRN